MRKEDSLLFHAFCFLMTQLKELPIRSERSQELHQQIKTAAWDKDGVAWSRFLRAKGHLLALGGAETLLSLALAEPEASPVAQAAEAYLRAGLHKHPHLRAARRPTIPVPSAVRRTLAGHKGAVTKLALTPQGLLSAGSDGTLRLWSLETGEMLRVSPAEEGIQKLILFADKRQALSLGGQSITWWDLEDWRALDSFTPSQPYNDALALHPDEGSFFDSDGSGRIYHRALSSGEVMRVFKGHSHRLAELLCLPGGRLLSASIGGELRFWRIETGECLHVLDSQQRILSVVANPEKTRALSGDKFGTITYWDLAQPKLLARIADLGTSSGALSFAFSSDGARAISGSFDGVLRLWDLRAGQEIQSYHSVSKDQDDVVWHQENQAFVANRNGTIHQIDLSLPSPADPERHLDHIASFSMQEQGPFALSGSFDGTLLLWDTVAGRLLQRLVDKRSMPIQVTTIHPRLPLGASTHWDGVIDLWDLQNRERIRQIKCPKRVTFLSFSSGDARLIALCDDDTLRIFSQEGALLWSAAGVDKYSPVLSLPDEKLLSLQSGVASIWSLHDGSRERELALGSDREIALHPDQKSILAIGKKLTHWRLSDATALITLPLEASNRRFGLPLSLGPGVVLPDGETLVHSGKQGELSLWSLRTGEQLQRWEAHDGDVYGVALFPENKLVSTGADHRLLLWDLSTQKSIASWQLESDCCSLSVTSSGRIICGDATGGVLMLDLLPG